MKPRECAGAINRAKTVFVFVPYGFANEGGEAPGILLQVPKTMAREIVKAAHEGGHEIDATMTRDELHIG